MLEARRKAVGSGKVIRTLLVLSFLLFPLFLADLAMQSYLDIDYAERRSALDQRIDLDFESAARNADVAYFFNALFQRVSDRHFFGNDFSCGSLRLFAETLKKKHPDTFKFIFWDKNGRLIKEVSDESRFRYLLEKLDELFKIIQSNASKLLSDNTLYKQTNVKLAQLRTFLGPFVPVEELLKLFNPDPLKICALCHGRGENGYLWYRTVGDLGSIAIFVNRDKTGAMTGLRDFFSATKPVKEYKLILFDEASQTFFPEFASEQQPFFINLQKFKDLENEENLESEFSFFRFYKVTAEIYLVAIIEKATLPGASFIKWKIMARVLVIIIISLFLLYCFFLVHADPTKSLAFKLKLIFVYVIAFPLLSFSVISFDMLFQSKFELISGHKMESLNKLKSIQINFNEHLSSISEMISFAVKPLQNLDERESSSKLAAELSARFQPTGQWLFKANGSNLFPEKYSVNIKNSNLIKQLCFDYISYYGSDLNLEPFHITETSTHSIVSTDRRIGKIQPFNLASKSYLSYMNLIPAGNSHLCLIMFWNSEDEVRKYLEKMRSSLLKSADSEFEYFFQDTPPERHGALGLTSFQEKAQLFGEYYSSDFIIDGKSFMAAGLRCEDLNKATLVIFSAKDKVLSSLSRLKLNIGLIMLMCVIYCLGIYSLIRLTTIEPITEISRGVEKLKRNIFSAAIPVRSANELGSLAIAVNRTMEHLRELEIAKTVQETLLPDNYLEDPRFEIFARTISMTRLGGDYFDFFKMPDGTNIILMADVSGHGVAAAILMAMTKATVLDARQKGLSVFETINHINDLFIKLKKSSVQAMLTCQFLTIDKSGSKVELFNCGHCAPIHHSAASRSSSYLTPPKSLPLGFKASTARPINIKFDNHDIFFMFSDGIIESRNSSGVMFGAERFLRLIQASVCDDLALMYAKVIEGYTAWREAQDDDITLMIVRKTDFN